MYVLTAAHCVDDYKHPAQEKINPTDFQLIVGTVNKEMEPIRMQAKRIVTGRCWKRTSWPDTWTDDVALIELMKAIEFDDYAQLICLPKAFRELPGDPAYFVGLGRTNST
ncbi:Peptidase S1/S6 [Aphelenchoides avenae]|nr:Peptidase S1/S6 [Aphelenchus avenae]